VGGEHTRAQSEQPHDGGELLRAVGVGVSARIVVLDLPNGEAQRGGTLLVNASHARTAVSQQAEDMSIVEFRRREQRCVAVPVHVAHGGVGRALEDHAHDARVPVPGCYYEWRTLVVRVVESLPA